MVRVAILLLAAGSSSRMRGAEKLLQDVDGEPLLRRQARAMLATGSPVIVTLPPDNTDRRAALAGLDVKVVEVADAAQGMSASLRAGVQATRAVSDGLAIVPADMPEITAQDMQALLSAFAASGGDVVVRGTGDGVPGHPVVFPSRLFDALTKLSGDTGARDLLKGEAVVPIALPERHALIDLDTPEDWTTWRRRRVDQAR